MYVHIYIINDGIIWLPIPSWLEFVNKQMCLEPISKKNSYPLQMKDIFNLSTNPYGSN